MFNKKEREQYNQYRQAVCERLGITKNQFNWFRRIGENIRFLHEGYCNGLVSNEAVHEIQLAEWYGKANKKANSLKLYIFYQTDPRGATIYLDDKPIPSNNYTIASCIY